MCVWCRITHPLQRIDSLFSLSLGVICMGVCGCVIVVPCISLSLSLVCCGVYGCVIVFYLCVWMFVVCISLSLSLVCCEKVDAAAAKERERKNDTRTQKILPSNFFKKKTGGCGSSGCVWADPATCIQYDHHNSMWVAVCHSVLQRVLQCIAVWADIASNISMIITILCELQRVAACCSALVVCVAGYVAVYVAVCCSVLQCVLLCVAVCCSAPIVCVAGCVAVYVAACWSFQKMK